MGVVWGWGSWWESSQLSGFRARSGRQAVGMELRLGTGDAISKERQDHQVDIDGAAFCIKACLAINTRLEWGKSSDDYYHTNKRSK